MHRNKINWRASRYSSCKGALQIVFCTEHAATCRRNHVPPVSARMSLWGFWGGLPHTNFPLTRRSIVSKAITISEKAVRKCMKKSRFILRNNVHRLGGLRGGTDQQYFERPLSMFEGVHMASFAIVWPLYPTGRVLLCFFSRWTLPEESG